MYTTNLIHHHLKVKNYFIYPVERFQREMVSSNKNCLPLFLVWGCSLSSPYFYVHFCHINDEVFYFIKSKKLLNQGLQISFTKSYTFDGIPLMVPYFFENVILE